MDEAYTGICVEYCFPIDVASTRGYVVLLNEGEYSTEEIEVLFELAMVRYNRRFGEVLFRPSDVGWPDLVAARQWQPRVVVNSEFPDLHRVKRIQLVKGARPGIHPPAAELVDKLDAMIEEDRQVRFSSR